jgi:hypothetical protein
VSGSIVLYYVVYHCGPLQLRQTWSAMLQTVPKMSRDKANALLSSADCTCPIKLRSLLLGDDTAGDADAAPAVRNQRRLLLQSHFGKGKSGKPINQAKLSRQLYSLVTSVDPQALLSEC